MIVAWNLPVPKPKTKRASMDVSVGFLDGLPHITCLEFLYTLQRPNSLNRGVQGLWASHRKARLNLNSAPPPGSAAAAAILQSAIDNGDQSPSRRENSDQLPESTESYGDKSLSTPGASASVIPTETTPSDAPISTKRKSRSDGGVSKRSKTSSVVPFTLKDKDFTPPSVRLSDLGGVQACVEKMLELVAMPICHPEVYIHTGVQPPRGVLLHGPPGCGKTMLAHAIAGVGHLACRNS